ncbi:MAG: M14 family metallopeptidase, partial [Isosphaeraceae bacterium]
ADRLLVVSSGLHGVEGFFGSASQLSAMVDRFGGWEPGPGEAVLLIHALNPYGFAWRRRFDEANVDLNRNFLVDGEAFEGAPPRYLELDALLNPKRGGGLIDHAAFLARATWIIQRWGLPALKEAVAGGQYERPLGLFFGGEEPAGVQRILERRIGDWVGEAATIRHLDLHTGLGPSATYKLLTHPDVSESRRDAAREALGDVIEGWSASGVAYQVKGDLGRWMHRRWAERDCLSFCAEFGTYPPLTVLAALRDENRAHHHLPEGHPAWLRAKRRLVEVFAPTVSGWRDESIRRSIDLMRQFRKWTFDPLERRGIAQNAEGTRDHSSRTSERSRHPPEQKR